MKFGLLKTKIEKLLSESYKNDSFKTQIKNFKYFVLENKKISRIFQIYNELGVNKGLDESTANDYINECVKIYENNINKLTSKEIGMLQQWVKDINTKNEYESIDNLFSNDITILEKKIISRKLIKESLKKKNIEKNKEVVKLPLSTMVNVANKTISNFIQNMNESEKNDFKKLISTPEKELNENFSVIHKRVLNKLTVLSEETFDQETKNTIKETIEKVSNEKCNVLTYIKLKNLEENL